MDEETKKLLEEATAGLKQKNKELLAELKTTQESMAKYTGVDIDALKAANDELAQLKQKKLEDEGEYKKLYSEQQAQHKSLLADKENAISELKKSLAQTKKESAVNLGLAGLPLVEGEGISEAAAALLIPKVAINDENEALIGDKPVHEYIRTDWAASAVGKTFLRSGNTGGGGNGAGGNKLDAASKFFDPKSGDFNLTEQGKLARTDPERYKELKAKYS